MEPQGGKSLLSKGYFGTAQEVLAAVWIFKVYKYWQILPSIGQSLPYFVDFNYPKGGTNKVIHLLAQEALLKFKKVGVIHLRII